MKTSILFLFFLGATLTELKECQDCQAIEHVYKDLRCTPKPANDNCCSKEYDCSHIYNRPPATCHLQGQFYKPEQEPDRSLAASRCDHAHCTCGEGGKFSCLIPSDSCAEFWVPGFVKPRCYLTYELNRCCNSGQKCPPFDNIAKCEVNGVTYREGERFQHPNQKCTTCICDKSFDGMYQAPSCMPKNCTTELRYSQEIENHCAPLYRNRGDCCPVSWVCPKMDGEYLSASTQPSDDRQCTFGDKKMKIGEKYEHIVRPREKAACECLVPPYLTCYSTLV